ncbi:unnamed protein product, partial [Closterium sp. NIES-54]
CIISSPSAASPHDGLSVLSTLLSLTEVAQACSSAGSPAWSAAPCAHPAAALSSSPHPSSPCLAAPPPPPGKPLPSPLLLLHPPSSLSSRSSRSVS